MVREGNKRINRKGRLLAKTGGTVYENKETAGRVRGGSKAIVRRYITNLPLKS
jgi:hypothetical protein